MADKQSQWALYNRTTQHIETVLPTKDDADLHLQYMLERGGVAAELVIVEVPAA